MDGKDLDIDVDSTADSDNESEYDDEDDDPFSNIPPRYYPLWIGKNFKTFLYTSFRIFRDENVQHSDPNSYAWCLMRYACIHIAQGILERFLSLAGVEPSGIYYLET